MAILSHLGKRVFLFFRKHTFVGRYTGLWCDVCNVGICGSAATGRLAGQTSAANCPKVNVVKTPCSLSLNYFLQKLKSTKCPENSKENN